MLFEALKKHWAQSSRAEDTRHKAEDTRKKGRDVEVLLEAKRDELNENRS